MLTLVAATSSAHLPDAVDEEQEGGRLAAFLGDGEGGACAALVEGVAGLQPLALHQRLEPARAHAQHKTHTSHKAGA